MIWYKRFYKCSNALRKRWFGTKSEEHSADCWTYSSRLCAPPHCRAETFFRIYTRVIGYTIVVCVSHALHPICASPPAQVYTEKNTHTPTQRPQIVLPETWGGRQKDVECIRQARRYQGRERCDYQLGRRGRDGKHLLPVLQTRKNWWPSNLAVFHPPL